MEAQHHEMQEDMANEGTLEEMVLCSEDETLVFLDNLRCPQSRVEWVMVGKCCDLFHMNNLTNYAVDPIDGMSETGRLRGDEFRKLNGRCCSIDFRCRAARSTSEAGDARIEGCSRPHAATAAAATAAPAASAAPDAAARRCRRRKDPFTQGELLMPL